MKTSTKSCTSALVHENKHEICTSALVHLRLPSPLDVFFLYEDGRV
jgi:hypothetical protein